MVIHLERLEPLGELRTQRAYPRSGEPTCQSEGSNFFADQMVRRSYVAFEHRIRAAG